MARSNTRPPACTPAPVVVEALSAPEVAGVAVHNGIITGATAVKDGVVVVGGAAVTTVSALASFLRRVVTG